MLQTFSIISTYIVLIATILFIALIFETIITNLLVKVPFVPTSRKAIRYVAQLANIQKDEKVYDLGCGDGRFLFEAQKYTNKPTTGFEKASIPYLMGKIQKFFTKSKAEIVTKNFFHAQLKDADVIYCYLGPEIMPKVAKKIQKECRKGTRIYSNSFSIKSMEPVQVWPKNKKTRTPLVYLYHVS